MTARRIPREPRKRAIRSTATTCPHGIKPKRDCRTCATAYSNEWQRTRRATDPEWAERDRKGQRDRHAADPERARQRHREWQAANPDLGSNGFYLRATRKPLVGPLEDYEGALTYLDCPACGETELINVVDRPLTCQVCGARVHRSRIWLKVPFPRPEPEVERAKGRDYWARLKVNDPVRYAAVRARDIAKRAARREAMLAKTAADTKANLDAMKTLPPANTDEWVVGWPEAA